MSRNRSEKFSSSITHYQVFVNPVEILPGLKIYESMRNKMFRILLKPDVFPEHFLHFLVVMTLF